MATRLAVAILAFALLTGASDAARDPDNPTCPANPNWSEYRKMLITPIDRSGVKILLAEGRIDAELPARLTQALADNPTTDEIWLRSPGGDARAGNAAGLIIRKFERPIITRIPSGWACFSACNFVFMGGRARVIDAGGTFIVHMFTMTGDKGTIDATVEMGTDATKQLIGDVEQETALLATEDNDFLIRMGVSRKLLSEVMYRQKAVASDSGDKSTRRCLTPTEALAYNVSNQQ